MYQEVRMTHIVFDNKQIFYGHTMLCNVLSQFREWLFLVQDIIYRDVASHYDFSCQGPIAKHKHKIPILETEDETYRSNSLAKEV